MSLFHSNNSIKFSLAAVSTCLLAACGGASDSANTTKAPVIPQPVLHSEVISNLTIKMENQTAQALKSQSSDGDNPVYEVRRTISKGATHTNNDSLNYTETLSFKTKIDVNVDDVTIFLTYNPLSKKVIDFYIEPKPKNGSIPLLQCIGLTQDKHDCQKMQLTYDQKTGNAKLEFNQTPIQDRNGNQDIFTLNGTIEGKLSIPPQNILDIPQKSSGTVTVNNIQKNIFIANADYGYIDIIFNDSTSFSIRKNDSSTAYSTYKDGENSDDFYISDSSSHINYHDSNDKTVAYLNNTPHRTFHPNANPEKTISANITVPHKIGFFTRTPFRIVETEKDIYPSQVSAFELINHNKKNLKFADVEVYTTNNKIDNVKINKFYGAIDNILYLNYQCSLARCQGVTLSPDGNTVNFNNTVLSYVGEKPTELRPTVTLNGIATFLGR